MAYYPLATESGGRYKLVAPDGISIAVFNDPLDPSYVGMLKEVTGLDSADVREAASSLTEADGGSHGSFYLDRRPIVLNATVFGHSTVAQRNLRVDRARRASLALRGDSILSWKPSTRQENLILNPSAEVDTSNWTANDAAVPLTRSTGWAAQGTASFRVTGTTAAAASRFPGIAHSAAQRIPVYPGQRLAGCVTANLVTAPPGATSVTMTLRFYDASGTWLGGSTDINGNNGGTVSPGIYKITAIGNAPANAASCQFIAWAQSNSSGAMDIYFDQIGLFALAPGVNSVPAYFDGDTAGYYWQGDAHASASGDFIEQYTTCRRQQPFRESGGWNKDLQIPLVSEFSYIFSAAQKSFVTGVAAENRGNVPAYPVVTIVGTSTNPTISDGTRTFRTTGLTLASGEAVAFDMYTHTGVFTAGARNGQSANRYIDFSTTTWPYLTGLGTTQTFTLTGGGTASGKYRDTWA